MQGFMSLAQVDLYFSTEAYQDPPRDVDFWGAGTILAQQLFNKAFPAEEGDDSQFQVAQNLDAGQNYQAQLHREQAASSDHWQGATQSKQHQEKRARVKSIERQRTEVDTCDTDSDSESLRILLARR